MPVECFKLQLSNSNYKKVKIQLFAYGFILRNYSTFVKEVLQIIFCKYYKRLFEHPIFLFKHLHNI